jgi:hypothetical protein
MNTNVSSRDNNEQSNPFLCDCNFSHICIECFSGRVLKIVNTLDNFDDRLTLLRRSVNCDCNCLNCRGGRGGGPEACLKVCILRNCSTVSCTCLHFNGYLRCMGGCVACVEKRNNAERNIAKLSECCCRCKNCNPICLEECRYVLAREEEAANVGHSNECSCINETAAFKRALKCDDCCYYRYSKMDMFVDEQRLLQMHSGNIEMQRAVSALSRNLQHRMTRKLRQLVKQK